MKETGKEHTGIAFVLVYSPPPSTQVISAQVAVRIEAAVGAVHRSGSVSNLCLQVMYHSPAAPPTKVIALLLEDPVPSWSFSCYTILSIIEGRVS